MCWKCVQTEQWNVCVYVMQRIQYIQRHSNSSFNWSNRIKHLHFSLVVCLNPSFSLSKCSKRAGNNDETQKNNTSKEPLLHQISAVTMKYTWKCYVIRSVSEAITSEYSVECDICLMEIETKSKKPFFLSLYLVCVCVTMSMLLFSL